MTGVVKGILSSCDAFLRSPVSKVMVKKTCLIANWKRCDHIRKYGTTSFNSRSKIKVRSHKLETPPRPTPKTLCINPIVLM